MIALGSKSYPYLAVAQYFEIEYSSVLSFIDWVENVRFIPSKILMLSWQCAAYDAYLNEQERRKQVSGV